MHSPPLSTELALRAFEADAAFSLALAELQEAAAAQPCSICAAMGLANQHRFSWLFRPCGDGQTEAVLRHAGGSEEKAIGDEPLTLLLGLLGLSALRTAQASEPDKSAMQETHKPQSTTADIDKAAQSLAAATGGEVVDEDAELPGRAQDDPLTDAERETAVAMVRAMDAAQRKAFTIAFRHAFEIPAAERAVAPLIQQFRHLEFVDRFTGEAAGVVKP